jgi:hypothetical protein
MAFHIIHRLGNMDEPVGTPDFRKLLLELEEDPEDVEHASVAVTHESEWSLSAFRGGYVVFEHLENGSERHMRGISDDQIIQLWKSLAMGDIQAVEQASWAPGY